MRMTRLRELAERHFDHDPSKPLEHHIDPVRNNWDGPDYVLRTKNGPVAEKPEVPGTSKFSVTGCRWRPLYVRWRASGTGLLRLRDTETGATAVFPEVVYVNHYETEAYSLDGSRTRMMPLHAWLELEDVTDVVGA